MSMKEITVFDWRKIFKYIPSNGEDVVIVKAFETRKGEWAVRDVATIPEVL